MAVEPTPKMRTTIEVGAVLAAMIFFLTLAFNSGIQYGQINALGQAQRAQADDIRKLQTEVAAQNNQTNASLARIEALVEDLRDTKVAPK